MIPSALHLFCGLGGGALGFKRAGFRSVGAIDVDADACADHEMLTGEQATRADLGALSPEDLRGICSERPDVVFTSPPCKAFSGCLPKQRATSDYYQGLSELSLRGIWLVLEAWTEPPPLIVMENVPRIQSRGRRWLEHIEGLLRAYGYAVHGSSHDCGELGGLAQRRRRYLLVARHMRQVPELLYRPPHQRVRGVGEVLSGLPVPAVGNLEAIPGGPMHRLPRLAAINWVRLALIPAGGDWRDLPERVRVQCSPRGGVYGVQAWDAPSGAVIGHARHDTGRWSVADPRSQCKRREGSLGVTSWSEASTAVIASGSIHNGPWSTADPRLEHDPRRGSWGVIGWTDASQTIRAEQRHANTPSTVADPRACQHAEPLDLDNRRPRHIVIRALDGTWHRPLTTLELAALQGLPAESNGQPLVLTGRSHKGWRQRIGNAVPVGAAEAIAREMAATIEAARGGTLHLSSQPVWVDRGLA